MNERSKYLSYLLRHAPENANLKLDREGWCSVPELIKNTGFTIEELREIVEDDAKTRYSFSADESKIRANQGHSTKNVRLTYDKASPPPVLYHGTHSEAYELIKTEGLKPMSRHHVHLSADHETAKIVGGRRKRGNIVLLIDAKQMLEDGFQFFVSTNGVWLTSFVPAKYIRQEEP